MKNTSNILLGLSLILLCSILAFSCKKKDNDKRDYYLAQNRDSLLVGKFKLHLEDPTKIQYLEFKATGKLLRLSVTDGETHTNATDYWYTSGNTLFTLSYNKSWDKGSYETQFKYWFSPNNDTLFRNVEDGNPAPSVYIRQE